MRYITDAEGYIKEISFGAMIECDGVICVEYVGSIPLGYETIEDWYMAEMDTLYRWKIPDGNLTLDESATAPEKEWVNPPMFPGVAYRTAERYKGKPVYRYLWEIGTKTFTGNATYGVPLPSGIDGEKVIDYRVRAFKSGYSTIVGANPHVDIYIENDYQEFWIVPTDYTRISGYTWEVELKYVLD